MAIVDYTKPWLSIDEQIDKLIERGLIVPDRAIAAETSAEKPIAYA